MSSINYEKVLKVIKPLKTSFKRNLINDISKMIIEEENDTSIIKIVCPYCEGKHIVKNGKNKEVQRYLCKICRRSFVFTTNTPIYYSKKDMKTWIKFVECLERQYSIRKTAKILNISISTAFFWRHKIFYALSDRKKESILKEKISCGKVIFNESFKGNHSRDAFSMPRAPYNNKTFSTINEISRQRITVLTAVDSKKDLYIAPVSIGKPSSMDLIRTLGNKVQEKSKISADLFYSYKALASFCNLKLCSKDAKTDNQLSNVKINIKKFFKPYRGVSTKYLTNYITFFEYGLEKRNNDDEEILFTRGKIPYYNANVKRKLPIF